MGGGMMDFIFDVTVSQSVLRFFMREYFVFRLVRIQSFTHLFIIVDGDLHFSRFSKISTNQVISLSNSRQFMLIYIKCMRCGANNNPL